MGKNKLLLIGGGGHCHSVLDSLLQVFPSASLGIIGLPHEKGKIIFDVPVIGCEENLEGLYQDGWTQAVVAVGSIGDVSKRERIFRLIQEMGFLLPAVVDPTAMIAKDSKVALGVFVGKGAILNAGVEVEEGAIINTGSIAEHDCKVGPFAHVSPKAVLCGDVHIGEGVHIGAGSTVIQGVSIGDNTLIGAGSVVLESIPSNVVAYGNPCRVIRNKV